jgi:hypothetical protein
MSESLLPDNIDFPRGMKLSQRTVGLSLVIKITHDDRKKIETLISTLDEIVAHIYSATKTLEELERS